MNLPAEPPPLQRVRCTHGDVAWREAGSGAPLVLLHGIGSGSASWAGQFEGLSATHRVIAWDAPGYGKSAALDVPLPLAGDYVRVLAEWLAAIDVQAPCVVGHSLGAIVAAAWAVASAAAPTATTAGPVVLILASPARGYGAAPETERNAKHQDRLAMLDRLGIDGLAVQRSANLCAPGASAAVLEAVRSNMARATAGGYRQAAHLLAHDDLATHLALLARAPRAKLPVAVLCGELDRVTPPQACRELAEHFDLPFTLLPNVAHACYVEDPLQFNAALQTCLGQRLSPAAQAAQAAHHV